MANSGDGLVGGLPSLRKVRGNMPANDRRIDDLADVLLMSTREEEQRVFVERKLRRGPR